MLGGGWCQMRVLSGMGGTMEKGVECTTARKTEGKKMKAPMFECA